MPKYDKNPYNKLCTCVYPKDVPTSILRENHPIVMINHVMGLKPFIYITFHLKNEKRHRQDSTNRAAWPTVLPKGNRLAVNHLKPLGHDVLEAPGIEPRIQRCKLCVLPLHHAPKSTLVGIEPTT